MATRQDARAAVIQILYALELGNDSMLGYSKDFLAEQKILNKQAEFALSLLHGVCENERFILEVMNIFLKTWDIERLGVVEKNILKLGIYEILYTQTERPIIINEAIELTKDFNVADASRLVNGVLDSISKSDKADIEQKVKERQEAKKEERKHEKNTKDNHKGSHKKNFKKDSIKGRRGKDSKKSEGKMGMKGRGKDSKDSSASLANDNSTVMLSGSETSFKRNLDSKDSKKEAK